MEIETHVMSLDEAKKLGIDTWSSWSCGLSTFDWYYDSRETAYVFSGRVRVTPKGGEPVEISGGMLAVFPEGMSCTWEVIESIEKVYKFG